MFCSLVPPHTSLMKHILTPLFFILLAGNLLAQNAFIKGKLTDPKTKETIVGAGVVLDDTTGTVTDLDGNYFIKTNPGKHKLDFKYTGYKPQSRSIELKENDSLIIDYAMEPDSKQLDIVVVSAGKFEQKLNEVTVSMEVLKPKLIESKGLQSIENAIDQVPGVNVIDGQANIRGGSGFSYGAGSRVLLMVDEMPMLSADAGDVKWTFLPVENCEQIEIIKGASSALFGSAAMNGVINFRTAYAKDKPETKIVISSGVYDKPQRDELAWWQNYYHSYSGINIYHAQKIQNLDLVIGANLFDDEGFRYRETEQRYRVNTNLRYNFQGKLQGLQIGVNANTIRTKGGLFLGWVDADSGAWRPTGGDLSHYVTYRTNVDPYISYFTKNNGKHTLRTRFYRIKNTNNTDQESVADVYYAEYQYQKRFKNDLTTTGGLVYNYNEVRSGSLYGNRFSGRGSAFLQVDKKWKRLTVSGGARLEYYEQEEHKLLTSGMYDTVLVQKVEPVFRGGVNYKLLEATFLRASYGQGFRVPAVAEKYIRTSASGLEIYPNDSLKPERGWSAEIGIKQAIRVGEWRGYFDVAGFWTEYRDMMEFTFGQWGVLFVDPYGGFGAKSRNIGNTQIKGFETTLMGEGKIGPVDVALLMGYTYIDPIKTDFDESVDTMRGSSTKNILKYRYQHNIKSDVEFGYKKVKFGLSARYNSYMENVDRFFLDAFPGVREYREKNKQGDVVVDTRLSYQVLQTTKVSFIVNNLLNHEYESRPMDMQPPRVFAVQLMVKF